ncbi:RNA exonuclease ngl2 [Rhodotorula kratochvilovae]
MPSPPLPSSSAPVTAPSPSPAPPADFATATEAADKKRAHRAQKKAEQQARKDERRRFADEHGVDPADLPPAVASALQRNGEVKPRGFKAREWIDVPLKEGEEQGDGREGRKVSIFSWNMLAQALVRRELFPGSDCLKGKDRLPALMEQVLYYSPDIACLQEVDRLSEHLPSLSLAYGYTSYVGYRNKSHGLLIAHKNSVFTKVGERGIRLDDLPLDDSALESQAPTLVTEDGAATPALEASGVGAGEPEKLTEKEKEIRARPPDAASSSGKASRRAAGLSRATRNVGLFVALEFKDAPGKGVIVGTTHTFWHPSHVYERVRQTALLVKELEKFREDAGDGKWRDWPLFLAGDLNTQPREMTYRLLTGAPVSPDLIADFERSRVVHMSVDKIYNPTFEPPEPPAPEPKEGEDVTSDDLSQHPDRIIKNSRAPTDEDGLATLEQLQALFHYSSSNAADERRVRSAYGEAHGLVPSEASRWYCARRPEVQMGSGWRVPEPPADIAARQEGSWDERVRRGDFEPLYSNFTPLWRCTLDYILLLPPSASVKPEERAPQPRWRSLLAMHDFHETCEPGLPRKGIEPSDHVAVATVVEVF